ncbi:MAG TPA: cytochrome c [Pyrinomonadaceae bacterium]|nr:cytochrome c [Pyrinomonadaceae bacterium]
MRELKLVILFVAAAAAVAACGSTAVNVATNPPANNMNKASVANTNTTNSSPANAATPEVAKLDGKQLYADNCMICHKDTGKGGPVTIDGKKLKPADLTSDRQKKHPDDDVAKDISEGSPDDGMPAFKDKLKPDEIKAIVSYIRTLQGP